MNKIASGKISSECKECGASIRSSATRCKPCNKINIQSIITKHGQSRSKTYRIWGSILNRGRDVGRYSICPAWFDFANFYNDMGECPENGRFIRLDKTKGFTPENCRWASETILERSPNTTG